MNPEWNINGVQLAQWAELGRPGGSILFPLWRRFATGVLRNWWDGWYLLVICDQEGRPIPGRWSFWSGFHSRMFWEIVLAPFREQAAELEKELWVRARKLKKAAKKRAKKALVRGIFKKRWRKYKPRWRWPFR